MKKIAILIAFVLAPMLANAQTYFDSLEDTDGVDMVVVTKDAFVLISKFKDVKVDDNEALQVFNMIKELKEFKMFSTSNVGIANKMETMANAAIKKMNLTQLMRIKEDNSRVKIYIKSTDNKDFVSQVLMFVKGIDSKTKGQSEAMIISLTGNIDINKMSQLADTFTKE